MPVKTVYLDDVGPVKLVKRRGAKSLRLSIAHDGTVRVGMPSWLPYGRGLAFAKERREWLIKQLAKQDRLLIKQGMRIGKKHRLVFQLADTPKPSSRIREGFVYIKAAQPVESAEVQVKALEAAERALKKEAEELFPERLAYLAAQHGFKYSELRIKKMRSRWGSCSSHRVIALSSYLVQLPWPLIDYVMVHELLHTRHMHHGPDFWADFENAIPNARKIKREINNFRPRLRN